MPIGFMNGQPKIVKKSSNISGIVRTPDYDKIKPNDEVMRSIRLYLSRRSF
jgi:hypothetical protein